MARGRVIGILTAIMPACAVAGADVAVGQSGFGLPGIALPPVSAAGINLSSTSVGVSGGAASVALPGVTVLGMTSVTSATVNLSRSGASATLPGVTVSNIASVTPATANLSGGTAAVALPGVSVAGVASVTSATVNLSGAGASVVLPGVNVAGVASVTPTAINLSDGGVAVALPGVDLGNGAVVLDLPTVGLPPPSGGLGDLINQTVGTTQLFAGMGSAQVLMPFEQSLDALAFGDAMSSGCAYAASAHLAPQPSNEVWAWNSASIGAAEHDGYQVSAADGNDCSAAQPFSSTESSAAPGALWDASSMFGLRKGTLHFGFTAGATETETEIRGSSISFSQGAGQTGAARFTSTSIGAYSLLTSGNWYAGTAVGRSWGRSESQDFVLGSASEYDTFAFVAAGILGRIVPIDKNVRLDLRGTLGYQRTVGEAHVDSLGIAYGDHTIETASGTISGRLFGVFRQGGMTLRPYLQAGITQRFHYDNELEIDGIAFELEEADTSVFAATGLDFQLDRSLQFSAGVRHEQSEDFDNLTARFGIIWRLN